MNPATKKIISSSILLWEGLNWAMTKITIKIMAKIMAENVTATSGRRAMNPPRTRTLTGTGIDIRMRDERYEGEFREG